jgi:thiamine-monophosphate kinase
MSGDEFAIIEGLFAPLATHPGARGLKDDAALFAHDGPLVITADTIVEGVHFLPDDPLQTIAQKALRVNLSDLAAKGARPLAYMHCLQWPKARAAETLGEYARGLSADQGAYGLTLLGGDLTTTPGPLAIAITIFGAARARTPARRDAQIGDDVWVTGEIGAAGLGLRVLRGETEDIAPDDARALIARYRVPEPRMAAAGVIAAFAHAAMDVSDGLLGDAARIAAASHVAVALDGASIPLAAAAQSWLSARDTDARRHALMIAGDDYEILFTAAPARRAAVQEAFGEIGLGVTRIGAVQAGQGVLLDGARVIGALSYVHTFAR